MSAFGGYAKPGMGAVSTTQEREFIASGVGAEFCLFDDVVVSSAARDAGSTVTTVLRPGLILGKLDSNSEAEEWDADAADGTQNIAGILFKEVRVIDFNGTASDRVPPPLVVRAPLQAARLLIQGSAFLGHADEYLARRQLCAAGCSFDDDPFGYKAGLGNRMATVTGTSDTLTAAENGTTLFYSSASAVAVTLPTIQPGLEYTIVRTGDEELVVSSAAGDDIICGGDASADSVTWTTASQQIGAAVRFRSFYVSTTLKWIAEVVPVPYSTGAFLASSFAS